MYQQSEKKLLSSNTSTTCPNNMVNFGPLTAEIGSGVWGTPTNFNGFCVLAALLHGIYSSGRQPNFAALNRGRHLCSAGRPSGWALAHILVYTNLGARPVRYNLELGHWRLLLSLTFRCLAMPSENPKNCFSECGASKSVEPRSLPNSSVDTSKRRYI